ncbi:hypothetical protein NPIL_65651 [Nephila pilipes]|uniref:Uncharacterized protein n=1 Tax=Nephila pilipes TaxID=299642 RepID=A0A8X6PLD8_NEPPI|nr:hypothetical protein NPIL_225231 [Nephila pilipes]GFT74628.1 hypothetical protein NPIL_65651 [Nephila pilipes]
MFGRYIMEGLSPEQYTKLIELCFENQRDIILTQGVYSRHLNMHIYPHKTMDSQSGSMVSAKFEQLRKRYASRDSLITAINSQRYEQCPAMSSAANGGHLKDIIFHT